MKPGIEIINDYNEQFDELNEEFVNLSDMTDAAPEDACRDGKNSAQHNGQ